MAKVTFIGAGPGDPDLITVKGKKAIEAADIIIYAGSLVNPQVLEGRKASAKVFDSAGMNLDEVLDVSILSVKKKALKSQGFIQEIHQSMVQSKSRWMPLKQPTWILM